MRGFFIALVNYTFKCNTKNKKTVHTKLRYNVATKQTNKE